MAAIWWHLYVGECVETRHSRHQVVWFLYKSLHAGYVSTSYPCACGSAIPQAWLFCYQRLCKSSCVSWQMHTQVTPDLRKLSFFEHTCLNFANNNHNNTAPHFHLIPDFYQSLAPLSPPNLPLPSPLRLYLRGMNVVSEACVLSEPVLEAPILGGQSVAGAVFKGHILVLGGTAPPALFAPTPQ